MNDRPLSAKEFLSQAYRTSTSESTRIWSR